MQNNRDQEDREELDPRRLPGEAHRPGREPADETPAPGRAEDGRGLGGHADRHRREPAPAHGVRRRAGLDVSDGLQAGQSVSPVLFPPFTLPRRRVFLL